MPIFTIILLAMFLTYWVLTAFGIYQFSNLKNYTRNSALKSF
jgi:hypothetical protein